MSAKEIKTQDSGSVLENLRSGNQRFAAGISQGLRMDQARRSEVVADGQHPHTTVITCSDSRVPVELIFDQGIGDLFVIRVAGNVCATDEIGSIEYGVGHLGTPVCLVLGHSHCGAVTAVATEAPMHGCVRDLVAPIRPAVARAKAMASSVTDSDVIDIAIRENIWQSISDLLQGSPDVRDCVKAGKTLLLGAYYDLETGLVEWLGPHPDQAKLLGG